MPASSVAFPCPAPAACEALWNLLSDEEDGDDADYVGAAWQEPAAVQDACKDVWPEPQTEEQVRADPKTKQRQQQPAEPQPVMMTPDGDFIPLN